MNAFEARPKNRPAAVRVVMLGTGDAFSLERACASIAVGIEEGVLLLDMSSGKEVLVQLGRAGIALEEVRAVAVTHQHVDHSGGLVPLLLHRLRGPGTLDVYCPAGALTPLQDVVRAQVPFLLTVLGDRVQWHACVDGDEREVAPGGVRLAFFGVEHGDVEALGVEVRIGDRRLVYSGDTRPCEALVRATMGADLLIHEAQYLESKVGPTADRPDSLHSTAADAGRAAARAGVRRLVLTHMSDGPPEWTARLEAEARAHYSGDVRVAADLDELWL